MSFVASLILKPRKSHTGGAAIQFGLKAAEAGAYGECHELLQLGFAVPPSPAVLRSPRSFRTEHPALGTGEILSVF